MTNQSSNPLTFKFSINDVDSIIAASQLGVNYAALQSSQSDELLSNLLSLKQKIAREGDKVDCLLSLEEAMLIRIFLSHGEDANCPILIAQIDKMLHSEPA